jgi:hypothetical protein
MIGRSVLVGLLLLVVLTSGCVKETYDLQRLSKNDHLSPTMALPAFNGMVSVEDLDIDLNLRFTNLQVLDTIENFLLMDDLGADNPMKPENFDLFYLDLIINNGFPLRVSIQMSLWDSVNQMVRSTVDATGILEAATVDSKGNVISLTESKTQIKFTKEFLSSIPKSDKIIFQFTFNTTNNGSNYVSLRSEFTIYFKAAVIFKPDIGL